MGLEECEKEEREVQGIGRMRVGSEGRAEDWKDGRRKKGKSMGLEGLKKEEREDQGIGRVREGRGCLLDPLRLAANSPEFV